MEHTEHSIAIGRGGNLADELEFADEDDDVDEDEDDGAWGEEMDGQDDGNMLHANSREHSMTHQPDRHQGDLQLSTQTDGARDSGVDVGYKSYPSPNTHPSTLLKPSQSGKIPFNFSRPISRDGPVEPKADLFTPEMEDAMNAVSRLANPPALQKPDPIPAVLDQLRALYPQTTLETHTQRLTTSTTSLSSHLTRQTRLIASLSSALFTPFGAASPLDTASLDDMVAETVLLLQNIPSSDARALQGLTRLNRETTDLLHTLSSLTDSLQVGKQATSSAARHLRTTQTMVSQLRLESELAEQGRWKIEREGWDSKLSGRWCARECSDVVGGFEQVCDGLRRGLEEKLAA